MTVEEFPADIEDDGDAHLSKYVLPAVILALTPVNATAPVLLIVTDWHVCWLYPTGADGKIRLGWGLNVHSVTANDTGTVLLPFAVDTVNVQL